MEHTGLTMQPTNHESVPQTIQGREAMTLRLPPRLNLALERYGVEVGIAKNAVVATALEEYLVTKDQQRGLGLFREPVQG